MSTWTHRYYPFKKINRPTNKKKPQKNDPIILYVGILHLYCRSIRMMKKKEEGKQTLMGKKHSTLYFFFTISSVYGWIEDDDDDDDDDELIIASPTISICKEYGSLLEPFF